MSEPSQATDATEVELQPDSWDFPGESLGQSMESLGTGYLQPISEPSPLLAVTFADSSTINYERDEIINLKFLKIQQKRSKRENSTGPYGAP